MHGTFAALVLLAGQPGPARYFFSVERRHTPAAVDNAREREAFSMLVGLKKFL
jgi:hypothetical protein